jgi:hypothetical protein
MKLFVDLHFRPEKLLEVLSLFKVEDRDSSGICRDIRDNEHSLVEKDFTGLWSCRSINPFRYKLVLIYAAFPSVI